MGSFANQGNTLELRAYCPAFRSGWRRQPFPLQALEKMYSFVSGVQHCVSAFVEATSILPNLSCTL